MQHGDDIIKDQRRRQQHGEDTNVWSDNHCLWCLSDDTRQTRRTN